jgi:hypothetical protein
MNIRLKQAVVAALALGAAGSAAAVDISTVPTSNVLYASGSTAIDAALKAYFYNSVDATTPCDPTQVDTTSGAPVGATASTIDVYGQAASGAASKFTAVACMSNKNLIDDGAGHSIPIAIIKEDGAGSLNGVSAVQNIKFAGSPFTDGKLKFPTLSTMTPANCGAGTSTTKSNLKTYFSHTCTSAVTASNITPQLGFSDVEGTLFSKTDPTTPVLLDSGPSVQVVFAPAVNLGLYHALQAVEGLATSDGLANMPSLSRPQLAAIFSGNVPTTGWSWIKGTNGKSVGTESVAFGVANTAACWTGTSTGTSCTTPGVSAVSDQTMYICRRGYNSGTQISAEIYLDDKNCATGVYGVSDYISGTCVATNAANLTTAKNDGCAWIQSSGTLSAQNVWFASGTGDLLDCLAGHDAAGQFAIGFASIDNLSGAEQTTVKRQDFRYIKVDGEVPSIENAAAGKYTFVAQSFWYAPPDTAAWSAGLASGTGALDLKKLITNKPTLALTAANNGIGTVSSVVGVNGASVLTTQGFNGGVLVIPGTNGAKANVSTVNATGFASNPVSSVTKLANDGATTSNCARPMPATNATETTAGWPAYAP